MDDYTGEPKITIRFTSDVSLTARAALTNAIEGWALAEDVYLYQRHDTSTQDWSIDAASHDRTRTVPLTDAQLVEQFRILAESKNMTVGQLLERIGK